MERGADRVGTVAMALPLTWQIAQMAGWVAQNVTAIFENVGIVQDGMRIDRGAAADAATRRTRCRCAWRAARSGSSDVRFGYGTVRGVLHDVSLDVRAGRARRAGRPVRRREVDARQPAAALLRRRRAGAS